jgi:hypothetical protein
MLVAMPPSRNAYGVKPKISGVDINGFPTLERVAPLCACPPVPGTPLVLEREQAIEERAIASECLPQILGCGLLAI